MGTDFSNSYPPALKVGDEFLIVAASSALEEESHLTEGSKILESWGLICRPSKINRSNWGYLAGKDSFRNKNLNPKKPAPLTIFARGGWGSARLLELPQNWQEGWTVGFSDVTSILLARLSAGLTGTIHGPLLTTLSEEPKWSQERLKKILFGHDPDNLNGAPWQSGIAHGPLVVANLTVATHLIGTKFFPDLTGAILIFEDVNEAPYRIDRMLTQWRLTGILDQLAGLGFGSFKGCAELPNMPSEKTFKVEQVLKERSFDLGIPIVGELPVGHCKGNAALPIGSSAVLDGTNGSLSLSP